MRAKRILFRQTDGRFREPSLERDFGLRTAHCPQCGSLSPYGRKMSSGPFPMPGAWQRPEKCGGCGKALPAEGQS